jgi:hypothetical protein
MSARGALAHIVVLERDDLELIANRLKSLFLSKSVVPTVIFGPPATVRIVARFLSVVADSNFRLVPCEARLHPLCVRRELIAAWAHRLATRLGVSSLSNEPWNVRVVQVALGEAGSRVTASEFASLLGCSYRSLVRRLEREKLHAPKYLLLAAELLLFAEIHSTTRASQRRCVSWIGGNSLRSLREASQRILRRPLSMIDGPRGRAELLDLMSWKSQPVK